MSVGLCHLFVTEFAGQRLFWMLAYSQKLHVLGTISALRKDNNYNQISCSAASASHLHGADGKGARISKGFPSQCTTGLKSSERAFFVFPFGSPLLLSWRQGQAAAGKSWTGFEVRGKEKVILSAACLPLLVHTCQLQRKARLGAGR